MEGTSAEARPLRPALVRAVVVLLAVVLVTQAVGSLRQKSVVTDELSYVAAGYRHLSTGDMHYNATNPPLLKMLAALPLLALDPELPPAEGETRLWNEIEQWRYARAFFYENRVDANTMLFTARMPTIVLALVLSLYVFVWARQCYGDAAGLFAMALCVLSPNILAHARFATQDLGLTLFMFVSSYHFWRATRAPSLGSVLASGAALGAAVLCKTTGAFLLPIFAIYGAVLIARRHESAVWRRLGVERLAPGRARVHIALSLSAMLALMGAMSWAELHAGYLFSGSFRPLSESVDPERAASATGLRALALRVPSPLPHPFVRLIGFQASRTSSGNNIYFRGETSREGFSWLMPFAFAVKTPLALLAMLAVALAWLVRRGRRLSDAECLSLIAAATVMALFVYLRKVSVGLRYVLPMYPFLFLLTASLLRNGWPAGTWARALCAVAFLAYASAAARIYPDYLAHFNPLVGPSNAYKVLADSFLDWGQDLPQLATWLEHNDVDVVRLAYFGSADPRYHGIDYEYLPSVGVAPLQPGQQWWYESTPESLPALDLSHGTLAVSATLWAGIFYPGYYAPLRALEPVAQIGHSILIYDLD